MHNCSWETMTLSLSAILRSCQCLVSLEIPPSSVQWAHVWAEGDSALPWGIQQVLYNSQICQV